MALEDQFSGRELELIRLGVVTLEDKLKRERSRLDGLSEKAVAAIDEDLDLLRGRGATAPGLKARLGVRSNDEPDPDQRSLEEEWEEGEGDPFAPDLRTQGMSVAEGKELANRILQDEKPAAAVRKLQALRAGEKERTPKARVTLLEHLQGAIDTAQEKVQALKADEDDGGSGE